MADGANADEAAAPAATAKTTLDVPGLRSADLLKILIGQINEIDELLGELFLRGLNVTIGRLHKSFPFCAKLVFACYPL